MSEATKYEESAGNASSGEPAHIAAILRRVHHEALFPGPLLLCLLTGHNADPFFEPMPRDPAPSTGQIFDSRFPDHLQISLALNPALHDGAIVLRRDDIRSGYRIEGWSYRLIAPLALDHRGAANRGSAYNSCLATSMLGGVDAVYLLSRGCLTQFVNGNENKI
jgi:hypothetical protein